MQNIQELREWLGEHRALGTRIMQEGADITDAEAVATWQDRMQTWCHRLISVVEQHDQAEAGRFEDLVRITHLNVLPNPMRADHQLYWRCHFERLVRLDDFLIGSTSDSASRASSNFHGPRNRHEAMTSKMRRCLKRCTRCSHQSLRVISPTRLMRWSRRP